MQRAETSLEPFSCTEDLDSSWAVLSSPHRPVHTSQRPIIAGFLHSNLSGLYLLPVMGKIAEPGPGVVRTSTLVPLTSPSLPTIVKDSQSPVEYFLLGRGVLLCRDVSRLPRVLERAASWSDCAAC